MLMCFKIILDLLTQNVSMDATETIVLYLKFSEHMLYLWIICFLRIRLQMIGGDMLEETVVATHVLNQSISNKKNSMF